MGVAVTGVRLTTVLAITALSGVPVLAGALSSGAAGPAGGQLSATTTAALRPPHTDFDGDGRDDLAVSSVAVKPGQSPSEVAVVRYSSGLPTQVLDPPPGPPANEGASAGNPLASGDFNGDGHDDLVLARPGDNVLKNGQVVVAAGRLWVFVGGPNGLDPAGTQIDQDTPGVPSGSEPFDFFGTDIAAGDINGDGRDDLAIGAYGEGIGTAAQAGAITVLLGSSSGLSAGTAKWFHQATANVPSAPEPFDRLGYSVAIGDVTGDHRADVVAIAPGENNNGAIALFRGASNGVTTSGADLLSALSIDGSGDIHGLEDVAVGDTNGDGRAEVIVGAPPSTVTGRHDTEGAVVVVVGRSSGLSATGIRVLDQDMAGAPEVAESGDRLGMSVAAGDVTGDGRADLLVGVPGENRHGFIDSGGIMLFRGSSSGLTGAGSLFIDQDTTGVPGLAAPGNQFGQEVSLLDLTGDGKLDGVVGAPSEASNWPEPNGSVTLFRGSNTFGLTPYQRITGPLLSTPAIALTDFGSDIVR